MKNKIKYILFLMLLFPINVMAKGGVTVSSNSIKVEKGMTATFDIIANNVIGDLNIISSDTNIATVDREEWNTGMIESEQEVTGTITITGNNVGSTIITLFLEDMATFDEDDLSGQEIKINVEVIEKGTIVEVDDINKSIEIVLKDADGNVLSNTIVGIYDESNTLLFSDVTNSEGILLLKNVSSGNYYFVLHEVPNSYVINREKNYFQVDNSNEKIELKVNISKTNVNVPSTGIMNDKVQNVIISLTSILIALYILIRIQLRYVKRKYN